MIARTTGIVSLAAGIGFALSMGAHAQNAPPSSAGDDMAMRVKQALHAQPALNDKHIDVSMKNGKVLMTGFVTSQGDLQRALRAADKAAGSKNVVNELKIKRDDDINPTGG